jgi:hypothetical protein
LGLVPAAAGDEWKGTVKTDCCWWWTGGGVNEGGAERVGRIEAEEMEKRLLEADDGSRQQWQQMGQAVLLPAGLLLFIRLDRMGDAHPNPKWSMDRGVLAPIQSKHHHLEH